MATPSKLASEWFPPHQRTLATSIAVVANTGVAFLLALPVHDTQGVLYLLYGEAAFAGLVRGPAQGREGGGVGGRGRGRGHSFPRHEIPLHAAPTRCSVHQQGVL